MDKDGQKHASLRVPIAENDLNLKPQVQEKADDSEAQLILRAKRPTLSSYEHVTLSVVGTPFPALFELCFLASRFISIFFAETNIRGSSGFLTNTWEMLSLEDRD